MTWLYIPNIEPSPSAPEPEDLNLASSLPDPERAASLTWRGKHMQPAHWSRAWKRDNWLRRLSGLTLPPSTLDHGVAAFIASLPEIPARRTASPGEGLARQASGSSLQRSSGSPTSAGLIASSAKTYRGMRTGSLRLSSQHWSDWATALRLEYSARPVSEEATAESDCSSWPTARVARGAYTRDQGDPEKPRLSLEGLAEQWMTPNVPNGGRSATHAEITGRTATHNGKKVQIGLEHQARGWATPTARDHFPAHSDAYIAEKKAQGHGMRNLNDEAARWRTPMTSDDGQKATRASHQTMLKGQAETWPTPCALDRPRSPETMEKCLAFRKRNANQNTVPLYLGEVALSFQSSAPDQALEDGPTSSPERRTLNPLFVEWLMGWPIGWTDCGSAEMEFTRWQQDMRGLLSTLCSRTPRQATLL